MSTGSPRGRYWCTATSAVRLAVCASSIKYDWLAPLMLEVAAHRQQLDYGGEQTVSAELRYAERGATLAFFAGWPRRRVSSRGRSTLAPSSRRAERAAGAVLGRLPNCALPPPTTLLR